MTYRWLSLGASGALALLFTASCSILNAPEEVRPGSGAGGAGGESSATSSSSSSSSSSASSSSGMMGCTPGVTESCYEGPAGTEGQGLCKGGTHTCDAMGAGFGPCVGQVLPAQEDCATGLVDEDCDGAPKTGCKPRVIAVSAAGDPHGNDMVAAQLATGAFAAVDLFDAAAATPTLEQLLQYDAALVTSNFLFQDPVVLGNILADYHDAGGRVVLTVFAVNGQFGGIQGRFGDPAMGYLLIAPLAQEQPMDALGNIAEPNSPLMTGVTTLNAMQAYRSPGGPINGGVVVASWGNGAPLVVRGVVKGRNRVDLNFFPPPTYVTGNHAELVRNALLFQ